MNLENNYIITYPAFLNNAIVRADARRDPFLHEEVFSSFPNQTKPVWSLPSTPNYSYQDNQRMDENAPNNVLPRS